MTERVIALKFLRMTGYESKSIRKQLLYNVQNGEETVI